MQTNRGVTILLFLACCLPLGAKAQSKKLTAAEAKDHIGERATIPVVIRHYAKYTNKAQANLENLVLTANGFRSGSV